MGELVLAAKITHVPSLMLSEQLEPLKGTRDGPINSLKLIGKRARERGADTFVVFDTHWISNFGFHINANSWHRGTYTSPEAPQMVSDVTYDFPGQSRSRRPDRGGNRAYRPARAGASGADPAGRIRDHRADALHEYGQGLFGGADRVAGVCLGRREQALRRSGAPRHRQVEEQGRDARERLAVASAVSEQPARSRSLEQDFQRVQPADGSARARSVARAPLCRILRDASGLHAQVQRRSA